MLAVTIPANPVNQAGPLMIRLSRPVMSTKPSEAAFEFFSYSALTHVLTITFEAPVSAMDQTWGRIKATYR
jgi:hypothetical protein